MLACYPNVIRLQNKIVKNVLTSYIHKYILIREITIRGQHFPVRILLQ